jgi:hypothetical protein
VFKKTMVSPKVSPKKKPTVSPKKKTYDIIPDEVTNEGYLNLGPLEETPGGGFSRNGSMMKKTKMKMGGAMKKAQNGKSFGMASVNAGYDNNSDATAADRIVLAKKNAGKAKNGAMMKMGGKMAKQAAVAIAMKKAGKAPKKKMQYGGEAASMKPKGMKKAMMGTAMTNAPMMKKGGSMKKCKYGCK